VTVLADHLDLAVGQARGQVQALAARRPVRGGSQDAFVPAGTLAVPGLREHVPETLTAARGGFGTDPTGGRTGPNRL
jgi:hypothetical protein